MKVALFQGCKIPYFVPQYEESLRAVCGEFSIELLDLEFNCCGYPVRNLDARSCVISSARNLALAEKAGLGIMTPCKCCYGSLKKTEQMLKERESLREQVNSVLAKEGLVYQGTHGVKHLLSVLFHDVGVDRVKERVTRPYQGLNIAVHYGCHALRPSKITQFDDPIAPVKFDRLVEATGAKSIEWTSKLQCCGNPLWGKNDALSLDLTTKKLENARDSGAEIVCVACTYCQIQFDTVQHQKLAGNDGNGIIPSVLYTQLLGLSMGYGEEDLGLNRNRLKGRELEKFLT